MLEVSTLDLDFVGDDSRVGFRLQRLEVLNWGVATAARRTGLRCKCSIRC